MFTDRQIFVWDYEALVDAERHPTDQKLLEASARLRRLLLDNTAGGTLAHKAAREAEQKLQFSIPKPSDFLAPYRDRLMFSFQSVHGAAEAMPAKLDQFLAYNIMQIGKIDVSVREVILYASNVAGGVHKGTPPKGRDNSELLHETAGLIALGGQPYPLHSLKSITQSTLEALSEIYNKLSQ
jgi:hypothetical protein